MGCCQSPANIYQTPKKKALPKNNQEKPVEKQKQKKLAEKPIQKPKPVAQKIQIPKIKPPPQKKIDVQTKTKQQVQRKITENQQQKAVKLVIDQKDLKIQPKKQHQQKILTKADPSRIYIDLSSHIQPNKKNQIRQSDIPDLQMITARKSVQQKVQEDHLKQDLSKYEICQQNYFDGRQFQLNMKQVNNFFIYVNPQSAEVIKKELKQQNQVENFNA